MITIPVWLILVVVSILVIWWANSQGGDYNFMGAFVGLAVICFWVAWFLRGCIK